MCADNLNEGLIFKFIETQALILAPICPHVAEKAWQLLGKVSCECSELFYYLHIVMTLFADTRG